jgi:hypothetical protein
VDGAMLTDSGSSCGAGWPVRLRKYCESRSNGSRSPCCKCRAARDHGRRCGRRPVSSGTTVTSDPLRVLRIGEGSGHQRVDGHGSLAGLQLFHQLRPARRPSCAAAHHRGSRDSVLSSISMAHQTRRSSGHPPCGRCPSGYENCGA